MSIRDTINERPIAGWSVVGVVFLIVAFLLYRHFSADRGPLAGTKITQVYFSDDDGATYFMDDAAKVPPYTDAHGKLAYRAHIYKCPGGQPFVGFLEGYSDEGKQQIENALSKGAKPGPIAMSSVDPPFVNFLKVKKPGETVWRTLVQGDGAADAEFIKTMQPHCPEGANVYPRPVWPPDRPAH